MDASETAQLQVSLKIHRAKLAQLFQRIQRCYDLCKDLKNEKVARQFSALSQLIPSTVTEFIQIEYKIIEIELSLNPEYQPVFNDSYVDLVAVINKFSESLNKPKSEVPTTSKQINESTLPKIELPIFTGKQKEWTVFYELFKSLVHDSSLSDQSKVQYLVSKLSGSAASICNHLPPIGSNYKIIWDALVSRYNNPRTQINSYLDEIFQFKGLKAESKAGLASILDRYCNSITALKRLHGDELSDLIFLYQGLKILDSTTRREFEIAYLDKDLPTYKDFVHFIEKQFRSLSSEKEKVEVFYSGKSVKGSSTFKNFTVQSPDRVDEKSNCLKCNQGSHNLVDCRSFFNLSPWERFRFVKEKSFCLKCLLKNHSARECKIKSNCNNCGKSHHSLLHFEFDKQSVKQTADADKSIAKSSLRKKKELEKQISQKCSALDNIQTILSRIRNVESDSQVFSSYKNSLAMIKELMSKNDLSEESVSNTMMQLQEVLEVHDEIQNSLGEPASSIIPNTDEDYEKELADLLADHDLTTESIDLGLPEPPTTSPTATSTKPQKEEKAKLPAC